MNFMILLVSILLIFEVESVDNLQVQINQGKIQGKYQETRYGRQYCSFTGIPYAQPPVGKLRFKAPLSPKSWKGILNATEAPPICPQRKGLSITGTEDCLYLNVYTPKLPGYVSNPLPVMFYIYGGGFVVGSGGPGLYGGDYLLDKDLVLVTPNYRIGALGFLSTEDIVVPGNNGLKDLVQALKWTKSNIEAFGGDPNKITVVGYSAGSAAAHFLILSPLSKNLISGAIIQSGTAVDGWGLASRNEAITNTKKLAKFLNCSSIFNNFMIDCLRKVNAHVIVQQDVKFLKWSTDPSVIFKPVIEPNLIGVTAFIKQHPLNIIKSKKAANIPLIIGITTDEGAYKSAGYYGKPQLIEDIEQEFDRVVPISMQFDDNPKKKEISDQLRDFNFGNNKIDNSTKTELTNMYTDVLFLMGVDISARLHAQYNTQPVYYYLFGYRGSESHSKIYGDPTHDYGVCHGDVLLYLFRLEERFPTYQPNATDNKMTDIFTTLCSNFIATGNPNSEDSLVSTKWESVQLQEDLNYLSINNPDDIYMAKGLFTKRARFVENLNIYYNNPV